MYFYITFSVSWKSVFSIRIYFLFIDIYCQYWWCFFNLLINVSLNMTKFDTVLDGKCLFVNCCFIILVNDIATSSSYLVLANLPKKSYKVNFFSALIRIICIISTSHFYFFNIVYPNLWIRHFKHYISRDFFFIQKRRAQIEILCVGMWELCGTWYFVNWGNFNLLIFMFIIPHKIMSERKKIEN